MSVYFWHFPRYDSEESNNHWILWITKHLLACSTCASCRTFLGSWLWTSRSRPDPPATPSASANFSGNMTRVVSTNSSSRPNRLSTLRPAEPIWISQSIGIPMRRTKRPPLFMSLNPPRKSATSDANRVKIYIEYCDSFSDALITRHYSILCNWFGRCS